MNPKIRTALMGIFALALCIVSGSAWWAAKHPQQHELMGAATISWCGPQVVVANVVNCFAVDNTGATDIGATLTKAASSLSSTGQVPYLPTGTYLANTVPTIPVNMTMQCSPGALFTGTAAASLRTACTHGGGAPFPITGILSSGQSLSVGDYGTPVLSTSQPYANAQLHNANAVDGGLWTYAAPDSGAWTLIPLIAPVRAEYFDAGGLTLEYPYNIGGETPDVAMANALAKLTGAAGGAAFLSSVVGQGGVSYTSLDKGSDAGNAYNSLLNEMTVAAGKGLAYGVGPSVLTHGEADATLAAGLYSDFLLSYQASLQADAWAITNQTRPVPLILSQQNSQPNGGGGANQSALEQILGATYGDGMAKTSTTTAWDSGAISTGALAGNGYLQFTVPQQANVVVGLTHAWSTVSYTDIDFGIDLAGYIFEDGSIVATITAPAVGDTMLITVTSGVVTYSDNGVIIYTSAASPTLPLYAKATINTSGGAIAQMKLSNGAALSPWLHQTGVQVAMPGSILMSGPKYYLPYNTDYIHLTAIGYQELGEQYARSYFRYLSPVGWTNFAPTSTVRVGNVVTMTFAAPVGPLVWDTAHTAPHQSGTLVAWALGNGFEARTGGAAGTLVTINSVAIQNGNQVVITCAARPDTIAYAHTPDASSGGTGGFPAGRCGLLRDSDPFIGPITGVAQYNWAPELQVTGL